MKIENSTYRVGSLKLGLVCGKMVEYSVPKLQEIKLHTEFIQLIVLWEVAIDGEQSYTNHIITLRGQKKSFLTFWRRNYFF